MTGGRRSTLHVLTMGDAPQPAPAPRRSASGSAPARESRSVPFSFGTGPGPPRPRDRWFSLGHPTRKPAVLVRLDGPVFMEETWRSGRPCAELGPQGRARVNRQLAHRQAGTRYRAARFLPSRPVFTHGGSASESSSPACSAPRLENRSTAPGGPLALPRWRASRRTAACPPRSAGFDGGAMPRPDGQPTSFGEEETDTGARACAYARPCSAVRRSLALTPAGRRLPERERSRRTGPACGVLRHADRSRMPRYAEQQPGSVLAGVDGRAVPAETSRSRAPAWALASSTVDVVARRASAIAAVIPASPPLLHRDPFSPQKKTHLILPRRAPPRPCFPFLPRGTRKRGCPATAPSAGCVAICLEQPAVYAGLAPVRPRCAVEQGHQLPAGGVPLARPFGSNFHQPDDSGHAGRGVQVDVRLGQVASAGR